MLTRTILLACLVLQFFLPWWIIGPVAFLFAVWKAKSKAHAFRSGFKAIFLLWLAISLIKSLPNHNILANRVGQMFMLPEWPVNWVIIAFVTALLGGLAGGLSAFAGYFWRFIMRKEP